MYNVVADRPGRRQSARFEAEYCSRCGAKGHNEDYVLINAQVGACVADGVGGAPLGDAVARYVCHEAMRALHEGTSAQGALEQTRDKAKRFLSNMDLPRSGASLTVLRFVDNKIETAWLGDVALFAIEDRDGELALVSSQDQDRRDEVRTHPLTLRSMESPRTMLLHADTIRKLAVCTDGVWKELGSERIAATLNRGLSARETAARLVLGHTGTDDATALVLACDDGR